MNFKDKVVVLPEEQVVLESKQLLSFQEKEPMLLLLL